MAGLRQVAYEALVEFGWNQKIKAIKAVRTAAPEYMGLREAKELVEDVQDGVPF
jgi:ribosomal protein L7/L12